MIYEWDAAVLHPLLTNINIWRNAAARSPATLQSAQSLKTNVPNEQLRAQLIHSPASRFLLI